MQSQVFFAGAKKIELCNMTISSFQGSLRVWKFESLQVHFMGSWRVWEFESLQVHFIRSWRVWEFESLQVHFKLINNCYELQT